MCALQVDTICRERRGPDVPVRICERAGGSGVPMCSKKLLTANAYRVHYPRVVTLNRPRFLS